MLGRSIENLGKGQLTIHVKHIKRGTELFFCPFFDVLYRFHDFYILEPFNINPWITVQVSVADKSMPGEARKWADVKRWDPRGLSVNAQRDNVAVTKIGAYGGHIKFERTMKAKTVGGGSMLGHWVQYGNQGWVPSSTSKAGA